ncbi:M18 family aminopeptidase [Schaedlerella arabinosiphila]|uniref:M18 family aminopeptidase n=1 Tax=Schaedlerella arabinosiphila TaxID=2044587 RepID=A0A9X5C5K6_9FIRM|nr:M18 family aminopeptidase [Schaedlerella arabinosiphila]KAI4442454.1 putative M18 family aminopeptidase 2 [Schaedlerella arabinosiphila]MCI8768129.1 M18 family aminopeptidase [Ruminococcus sp.]NDO68146.1 M18 family aminopeptidase [Schaedlerella arabinosiphila]
MHTLAIEISQLFEFLKNGTSAFHVTAHSKKVLTEAGFTELKLKEPWPLERGGRYFCCPFDTTLYAFTIGRDCDLSRGIHIGGAHTDFPAIKIKPKPEIFTQGYMQLNTELYGGPILSTFFDRSLSLAGKVVTRGSSYDRPVSHLIDFQRPVACLPNLAIHMNRTANEKGTPVDNQKHLLPILGTLNDMLSKDSTLVKLLAEKLDVDPSEILDYDLCLYNLEQPELAGITEEFLCAPRLDDITSVCALVHALAESQNPDRVNLVCLFDHEEIGSLSKQGADSFLPNVIIGKIWQAFGKSMIDCMADLSDGLMLSADVAHAYHPNYPAVQDVTNYPVINQGFVFKSASNQSYAWDCEALASMIALCEDRQIPYQRFAKHSNTKGGGTIASILSSHLPVRTIDTGAGILAMHSSREMMGVKDQIALSRFAKAFFE